MDAQQMSLLSTEECGGDAIIDGNYRYQLRRWWSSTGKILVWVLLNPSTADGTKTDATLRRIIYFTKREGYQRFIVVNLFAYRSPYPEALKEVADPIGPANEYYLQDAFEHADKIVVGWGAFDALQGRDLAVLQLCTKPVYCLGTTQNGYPRHPSRLANTTPLVVYQPPCFPCVTCDCRIDNTAGDMIEYSKSDTGEAAQMDEHHTVGDPIVEGHTVDSTLEVINHDQLLDGMLQGDVPPEIETAEIEATQTRLIEAVQMTLPGLVTNPVTIIDHPPGRAVRQASLAPKNSWRAGRHKGGQTQRLYYVADNGLEISLGTPENPLDLEEAKKQIKRAGELTVLIDRLLFWFWLSRSRPRPGDGKTFVGRNGSVPISIEELLDMLGYKKHSKREGNRRYSDGYRTEDKDRLTWNIALLAAFQVSSIADSGFGIQGAYLRYSLGFWDGVHAGYLISPGDWIETMTLPDNIPGLMSIDQQIFQFDCQRQQHEIRLCLYLAEAFRDQFRQGTLGEPLRVPVEGHPGKTRLITMEELLRDAQIKIDRNNLTQRFVPRIEEALETLVKLGIVARAEPVTPVDKTQGYWGKAWCSAPMIIQAPESLVNEYLTLSPAIQPPLLTGPAKGRKRSKSRT